jgi:hypothetical protein
MFNDEIRRKKKWLVSIWDSMPNLIPGLLGWDNSIESKLKIYIYMMLNSQQSKCIRMKLKKKSINIKNKKTSKHKQVH